ncbi:efflux transporter outer membrane subunit [Nitrosomonas sp.]|uniref:efflux transporter outer membrane subunit n=1 Tax=Nitrosomonas sp. TaxID=42353 RepID=UPI0025E82FA3|nr:efflux transporter outer membrane subunit [Nitrosomonas sp.]
MCLLILISGCNALPERSESGLNVQIPLEWRSLSDLDQPIRQYWVDSFDDPVLSELIENALVHNFDLKSAAARVEAAIAQARIDGSGLWPQLSFAPAYQYSQVRNAGFGSAQFSVFEGLFNLSWELDVWGRIGDFRQAAAKEAEAANSDYHAAQLSLAARIAQNYFALQEAILRTHVATQSVADRSVIANLVQGRFDRGLARGLDVRLALTDLANARSRLAEAKNRTQLAVRQLETLLERYPEGSLRNIMDADAQMVDFASAANKHTLPEPPPALAAGLPSELLTRRPDLIAAFTRLRAADSRLQSTQKLLLPRITLTAAGGTRDSALTDLIDPRAVVWNVFAGMAQPLFTGGRIRGNIHLNTARVEEALNRYQSIVLNAFREVEQALAAEEWLREQERVLREAVEQTEASQELALYSYRHGFIQILTLLDSYRSTFNAQSAHLAVKQQLLSNRINLYLALGGGV